MRIWISDLPSSVYDANGIHGNNSYLLMDYIHQYVTRNNKIYFVSNNSKFAFWINPITKITTFYKTKDKKALEIYYNNTKEIKK